MTHGVRAMLHTVGPQARRKCACGGRNRTPVHEPRGRARVNLAAPTVEPRRDADRGVGRILNTMAVKMRLRREGKKKQPFYRVVVADVRSPRDGRFIDDLGYYQPLRNPSEISIDHERALYWLRHGVQPSDAVKKLLRIEGIWEQFKPGDPGKDRSAKHAVAAQSAPAPAPTPAPEAAASAEEPAAEAAGEDGSS
jgi:small subunit ribosomal protein S16